LIEGWHPTVPLSVWSIILERVNQNFTHRHHKNDDPRDFLYHNRSTGANAFYYLLHGPAIANCPMGKSHLKQESDDCPSTACPILSTFLSINYKFLLKLMLIIQTKCMPKKVDHGMPDCVPCPLLWTERQDCMLSLTIHHDHISSRIMKNKASISV
jgi:hypothetical protein